MNEIGCMVQIDQSLLYVLLMLQCLQIRKRFIPAAFVMVWQINHCFLHCSYNCSHPLSDQEFPLHGNHTVLGKASGWSYVFHLICLHTRAISYKAACYGSWRISFIRRTWRNGSTLDRGHATWWIWCDSCQHSSHCIIHACRIVPAFSTKRNRWQGA